MAVSRREEIEELRKELKQIEIPKKKRRKKNYKLRFLVLIFCITSVFFIMTRDFFNVDDIQVEGNSYYSADQVINIADAKKGGNIFWGSGIGRIKKRIRQNPYFSDVSVSRRLPSKLVIKVKERKQSAAIVYGEDYVVLDRDGTYLRIGDLDPKLTLIVGVKLKSLKKGEAIEADNEEALHKALSLLKVMEENDFYFKKIDVSSEDVRGYINDGFVCKGDIDSLKENIANGSLVKIINNLLQNSITRGTINIGENNFIYFSPEL